MKVRSCIKYLCSNCKKKFYKKKLIIKCKNAKHNQRQK